MIELISDHVEESLNRLIEQYKGKTTLENLLTALVAQLQDTENAAFPMSERLDVFEMEGRQLDLFGKIVVQGRLGLQDQLYRLFLLAKIGVNISNGDPERLIATFRILTQGDFVHLMVIGPGVISLSTDGTYSEEFADFIFQQMERTAAGGVRILDLVYAPSLPFAFDGPNLTAPSAGFGTLADVNIGGGFAQLPPL